MAYESDECIEGDLSETTSSQTGLENVVVPHER